MGEGEERRQAVVDQQLWLDWHPQIKAGREQAQGAPRRLAEVLEPVSLKAAQGQAGGNRRVTRVYTLFLCRAGSVEARGLGKA